ncbi:unnamed protein product, partial [Porites lobata]
MTFSPLRPLPPLHREPRESRSPDKLEALALLAVPNTGEAARENLLPCHSVRIKLEAREFEEARHVSNDVVFSSCRQTLRDLRCLPLCSYTDWVFNNVECHCNIRLGTLRLLIDDFINFMNYREFNPV